MKEQINLLKIKSIENKATTSRFKAAKISVNKNK